jgi:hypothetical protein
MDFNYQNCYLPQSPQLPPDLADLPTFHFDQYQFMEELAYVADSDHPTSHPSPSYPNSTNLLEVITTSRGKPMIIHEGNLFQQRSQAKDGRITYRCSLYHQRTGSCTAILTTDSQRSLVLSNKGTDNHPDRSPNTLDQKRRGHRLKELYAGNPSKPIRVAAEELGVVVTPSMRMKCRRMRNKTWADVDQQ